MVFMGVCSNQDKIRLTAQTSSVRTRWHTLDSCASQEPLSLKVIRLNDNIRRQIEAINYNDYRDTLLGDPLKAVFAQDLG